MNGNKILTGLPKDWKKLIKTVQDAGWRIEETNSGLACYSPDEAISPVTLRGLHKMRPGDRTIKQKVAEFRRAGVDV